MEIISLATLALTLATPYLQKVGEGAAQKIGEDVWSLIKKPFQGKAQDISETNLDSTKENLIQELRINENFRKELEDFVTNVQNQQNNNQQNINNSNATIEKQVNIGSISGTVNL